MADKVKKVDPRVAEKAAVKETVLEALTGAGFEVVSAEANSVFVRMENGDIEVKLIAKKEPVA